jgi:hypothetical protein
MTIHPVMDCNWPHKNEFEYFRIYGQTKINTHIVSTGRTGSQLHPRGNEHNYHSDSDSKSVQSLGYLDKKLSFSSG